MLSSKQWIICRVCLKQHEYLYDITMKVDKFDVWLLLRDCGGIPVFPNDDFPNKICEICIKRLWKCNKFRLSCQRGHREIAQMLMERNFNIYEQSEEEKQTCADNHVETPEKVVINLIDPKKDLSNKTCVGDDGKITEVENFKEYKNFRDNNVMTDLVESTKYENISNKFSDSNEKNLVKNLIETNVLLINNNYMINQKQYTEDYAEPTKHKTLSDNFCIEKSKIIKNDIVELKTGQLNESCSTNNKKLKENLLELNENQTTEAFEIVAEIANEDLNELREYNNHINSLCDKNGKTAEVNSKSTSIDLPNKSSDTNLGFKTTFRYKNLTKTYYSQKAKQNKEDRIEEIKDLLKANYKTKAEKETFKKPTIHDDPLEKSCKTELHLTQPDDIIELDVQQSDRSFETETENIKEDLIEPIIHDNLSNNNCDINIESIIVPSNETEEKKYKKAKEHEIFKQDEKLQEDLEEIIKYDNMSNDSCATSVNKLKEYLIESVIHLPNRYTETNEILQTRDELHNSTETIKHKNVSNKSEETETDLLEPEDKVESIKHLTKSGKRKNDLKILDNKAKQVNQYKNEIVAESSNQILGTSVELEKLKDGNTKTDLVKPEIIIKSIISLPMKVFETETVKENVDWMEPNKHDDLLNTNCDKNLEKLKDVFKETKNDILKESQETKFNEEKQHQEVVKIQADKLEKEDEEFQEVVLMPKIYHTNLVNKSYNKKSRNDNPTNMNSSKNVKKLKNVFKVINNDLSNETHESKYKVEEQHEEDEQFKKDTNAKDYQEFQEAVLMPKIYHTNLMNESYKNDNPTKINSGKYVKKFKKVLKVINNDLTNETQETKFNVEEQHEENKQITNDVHEKEDEQFQEDVLKPQINHTSLVNEKNLKTTEETPTILRRTSLDRRAKKPKEDLREPIKQQLTELCKTKAKKQYIEKSSKLNKQNIEKPSIHKKLSNKSNEINPIENLPNKNSNIENKIANQDLKETNKERQIFMKDNLIETDKSKVIKPNVEEPTINETNDEQIKNNLIKSLEELTKKNFNDIDEKEFKDLVEALNFKHKSSDRQSNNVYKNVEEPITEQINKSIKSENDHLQISRKRNTKVNNLKKPIKRRYVSKKSVKNNIIKRRNVTKEIIEPKEQHKIELRKRSVDRKTKIVKENIVQPITEHEILKDPIIHDNLLNPTCNKIANLTKTQATEEPMSLLANKCSEKNESVDKVKNDLIEPINYDTQPLLLPNKITKTETDEVKKRNTNVKNLKKPIKRRYVLKKYVKNKQINLRNVSKEIIDPKEQHKIETQATKETISLLSNKCSETDADKNKNELIESINHNTQTEPDKFKTDLIESIQHDIQTNKSSGRKAKNLKKEPIIQRPKENQKPKAEQEIFQDPKKHDLSNKEEEKRMNIINDPSTSKAKEGNSKKPIKHKSFSNTVCDTKTKKLKEDFKEPILPQSNNDPEIVTKKVTEDFMEPTQQKQFVNMLNKRKIRKVPVCKCRCTKTVKAKTDSKTTKRKSRLTKSYVRTTKIVKINSIKSSIPPTNEQLEIDTENSKEIKQKTCNRKTKKINTIADLSNVPETFEIIKKNSTESCLIPQKYEKSKIHTEEISKCRSTKTVKSNKVLEIVTETVTENFIEATQQKQLSNRNIKKIPISRCRSIKIEKAKPNLKKTKPTRSYARKTKIVKRNFIKSRIPPTTKELEINTADCKEMKQNTCNRAANKINTIADLSNVPGTSKSNNIKDNFKEKPASKNLSNQSFATKAKQLKQDIQDLNDKILKTDTEPSQQVLETEFESIKSKSYNKKVKQVKNDIKESSINLSTEPQIKNDNNKSITNLSTEPHVKNDVDQSITDLSTEPPSTSKTKNVKNSFKKPTKSKNLSNVKFETKCKKLKQNTIDQIDETIKTNIETPNSAESLDDNFEFLNLNDNPKMIMDTADESLNPNETQTIEIANGKIKHYCIIKRNPKIENNDESLKNDDEQKPIVLVLKLKNDANSETITEPKSRCNTKTKSTTNLTTYARPVTRLTKCNSPRTTVKNKLNSNTNISKILTKKKKVTSTRAKYVCGTCKKNFVSCDLLRHHNYMHTKPHLCKICGYSFSQKQSYLSHLNTHTRDKPYFCRICYVNFSDIANRNSHERRNHKTENKVYKCSKCEKKFRILSMLQKHANIHRSKTCSICDKVFSSLQVLRRHHQMLHLNIKQKLNKGKK